MKKTEPVPIDFNRLKKLTDNNQPLANELLDMFVTELPSMKNAIHDAFKNNHLDELQRVIHKLHGSCCYCAANKLQRLAQEAESQLQRGNQTSISRLILAIDREIVNILHYLGNIRASKYGDE